MGCDICIMTYILFFQYACCSGCGMNKWWWNKWYSTCKSIHAALSHYYGEREIHIGSTYPLLTLALVSNKKRKRTKIIHILSLKDKQSSTASNHSILCLRFCSETSEPPAAFKGNIITITVQKRKCCKALQEAEMTSVEFDIGIGLKEGVKTHTSPKVLAQWRGSPAGTLRWAVHSLPGTWTSPTPWTGLEAETQETNCTHNQWLKEKNKPKSELHTV